MEKCKLWTMFVLGLRIRLRLSLSYDRISCSCYVNLTRLLCIDGMALITSVRAARARELAVSLSLPNLSSLLNHLYHLH